MKRTTEPEVSFDDFDDLHYPRPAKSDIASLIDKALSRRKFLSAALASSVVSGLASAGATRSSFAGTSGQEGFHFTPVATTAADTITLPKGFNYHVMVSWGDPMWSQSIPFDRQTLGTGQSQELAFGDNCDGMSLFRKDSHIIMAVNNEYVNRRIFYANRPDFKPHNSDDVRKAKAGHGISIVEVEQRGDQWSVVLDSPFNYRITADTPMEITGPAAGHDLLKTAADPTGTKSLGTWNNCAHGQTPWGTYLTCEENFNGYFSSQDEFYEPTGPMQRYSIGHRDWGYNWAAYDERFDISKHPNECNRVGYVVEIDPFNSSATPKKRTALGRFKHENAEVVIAVSGHVVVYLGDDERGEYLYRFVSDGKFVEGGDNADLLQSGKLYAALFHDDLKGQWLELSPQTTGMASQAEICIHTRLAASIVKATTMDRPEWVAIHPDRPEVYCNLTNNKNRGIRPNRGGDETPVGGPNPRAKNKYGQIVRWRPANGDHSAANFTWDLFVIAGNPTVHNDARKGSKNITPDNMFNSPDGLSFDAKGKLWIRTDGSVSNKGDFAGMGNNQMLVADPDTGEINRFLVGPLGAELSGLLWSPDRKTLFMGVQHPGAKGKGSFPDGGTNPPRSSIVAIRRDDGGVME